MAVINMHRPAIKRVHRPLVLPGGRIQLGLRQYGIASEIHDEDGSVARILALMDGTRDLAGIWSELHTTHPDWGLDDVRDVIGQLASARARRGSRRTAARRSNPSGGRSVPVLP